MSSIFQGSAELAPVKFNVGPLDIIGNYEIVRLRPEVGYARKINAIV